MYTTSVRNKKLPEHPDIVAFREDVPTLTENDTRLIVGMGIAPKLLQLTDDGFENPVETLPRETARFLIIRFTPNDSNEEKLGLEVHSQPYIVQDTVQLKRELLATRFHLPLIGVSPLPNIINDYQLSIMQEVAEERPLLKDPPTFHDLNKK
jgi:hypothetical protein